MTLHKIHDFDPDYGSTPNQSSIQNFDVYTDRNEKVGRVVDALLDQSGNFRYFVVDLSQWFSGKQVLVPLGRTHIDPQAQRVEVRGLTRAQAQQLPTYHSHTLVDDRHEEQVRTVYHMRTVEDSAPLETETPLEGPRIRYTTIPTPPAPVTAAYADAYQADPDLYAANDRDHRHLLQYQERLRTQRQPSAEVVQEETIPLMEERVVVDRKKQRVGEVVVRKEVETEIVQVPVRREKLIIEQVGAEPKQLAEIDLASESVADAEQRRLNEQARRDR